MKSLDEEFTEVEMDQYDELLLACGEDPLTIEMIDATFAASIAGPCANTPLDWLDIILGGEPRFDNQKQAKALIDFLMRHWNLIATTISQGEGEKGFYFPFVSEDEEGRYGQIWSSAFLAVVKMQADDWEPLLSDDENFALITPAFIFANEFSDEPELQPQEPLTPERRQELFAVLLSCLPRIFEYFAKHQHRTPTRRQFVRSEAKVGRNEPCPCGSGKKFKQCCGKNTSTLH